MVKKELNVSTYPTYLIIFRSFECTKLILKETLLNLLHFIFTEIAIFIKPWLNNQIFIIKQYNCIKEGLKN